VIGTWAREWRETTTTRTSVRRVSVMLMALITLFVLFVATWIALFLSKQISIPITALAEAASQVRKGNLSHRVKVRAADELGLAGARLQPDDRRNWKPTAASSTGAAASPKPSWRAFPRASFPSAPTAPSSASTARSARSFPRPQVEKATRLEDLFSREDTAEIKYLMKRARRTGPGLAPAGAAHGKSQPAPGGDGSALEEKLTSGFVIVLEDTSELLRAQKAAAWHEVARRVAHEIKNPLTPSRFPPSASSGRWTAWSFRRAARILDECARPFRRSVESVKTLVDEFSQFARFPAAQPVRSDLNEVVRDALAIFHGRLDGIDHAHQLRPGPAAGEPGPRAVPARGGEPGG
jgi:two-component system, NtrC family, nitrogen regulation sensor histidine kinase NtrY